jgi:hypothetical protein
LLGLSRLDVRLTMQRPIDIRSNSPDSTQAPTPLLDQSVKELSASASKKDHYKSPQSIVKLPFPLFPTPTPEEVETSG